MADTAAERLPDETAIIARYRRGACRTWRGGGALAQIIKILYAEIMNTIDSNSNELDALVGIIVKTVPVDQIYLFGSFANGTPHADSDFDLYVVLKNEAPMREVEAMDAIGLATFKNLKRNRPIDLLVHKKDKFLDRSTGISTIEKVVLTEGIKIYV